MREEAEPDDAGIVLAPIVEARILSRVTIASYYVVRTIATYYVRARPSYVLSSS